MNPPTTQRRWLLLLVVIISCQPEEHDSASDASVWHIASGNKANTKYSSLEQINADNVHLLEVAWEYKANEEGFALECTPIVIGDILYATTPRLRVVALNATTGIEQWTFDPFAHERDDTRMRLAPIVNRGVTYWQDAGDSRVFFGAGPYLYALDAKTGRLVGSFGEGGRIDLLEDLDREMENLPISATSPSVVYGDLLIVGAMLSENQGEVAPGHVRAFDVRTGERKWIFHTIPHPGEEGYETWSPDSWKTFGGANAWGGFSLDEERGIVFFGTGSASHDHFGAERLGKNLYANSVVALDASSGQKRWHYQLVHHDLWDYDIPTPPNLATIQHEGRLVDVAAQVTKMGMLFVFDRETGEPIFEIEERSVPQTSVPGEKTWPTQPFPSKPPPYARQSFSEQDITDRTPEAAQFVRENLFETYGAANIYDPPSFKGDIVHPQFNGGTDWGGAAVDEGTGWLYVPASNEPELMRVIPAPEDASFPYRVTGHQPVKDNEGFPINTPPWGTLSAIDLNSGNITWQVPFGGYPDSGYDFPTGTFNMGGPVVTAGGLVFIGGSMDEKFRAFDKTNGDLLWEHQLPAGGYATPATYVVDGKQYVVIAAGGGGKPGTKAGDAYVAFTLPEEGATERKPTRSEQVFVEAGEQLYTSRCASCHQYNGQGLGSDYPPLQQTDWVTGDKERLIKVILGGLTGEMTINEVTYNGSMPPWRDFLNDQQVAELLTFIRNSWGNNSSEVFPAEVKEVRASSVQRAEMWTAEELR